MIYLLKNKLKKDKHFKEILHGSVIAFILRLFGIFSGYVFTLLIARNYGAEVMGIFSLSFILLQILSIIAKFGMDTAFLRFVVENVSKGKILVIIDIYKKIVQFIIPFSALVSIIFFFLSPFIIEHFFKKDSLYIPFKLISLGIIPFSLLYIHAEGIRGLKRIKEYMLLQHVGIFFLSSIFLGVSTLFFVHFNLYPIISYLCSIFILSFLSYVLWNRFLNSFANIDIIYPKSFGKYSLRSILAVSVPMLLSNSLSFITGWIDIVILGIFKAEKDVGIYNVIFRIATITNIALIAVNTIAAPKFAEFFAKQDIKNLKKIAIQSTKLTFWISFPIILLILVFPERILGIFGEEFKYGVLALVILIVGQVFHLITGNNGSLLYMTGYQKIDQYINIFSFMINVILDLLLVGNYGIVGVAIGTTLAIITKNIFILIFIKYKFNFFMIYFPIITVFLRKKFF